MYSKIIRKLTRLISQRLLPNNCLHTFHNQGVVYELENRTTNHKSVFEVGFVVICIVKNILRFVNRNKTHYNILHYRLN